MESEKWTDEELIQVYDLQEKYTEKVIDFVRNGSESEVLKFLQIIPDLFEHWKGADNLRDVFEEKYQWDFATARPETLALFAGNMEIALETYSIERYEKLRQEIPHT